MSRRPHWWLAVPLALVALMLGAAPAFAAHAVKVSPKNMHGWVFFEDNAGGPGSGQMVKGPGDPPLGVGSAPTAGKMVQVLAALGHERALVFYSEDGLDELSTVADSHVFELRDGVIREYTVDPVSLGLPRAEPADLKGGDAEANAEIIRRVLDGQPGPQRDVVLLNAAAGLVAADRADDFAQGIQLAAAAIDGHAAQAALEDLRIVSRSLVKA